MTRPSATTQLRALWLVTSAALRLRVWGFQKIAAALLSSADKSAERPSNLDQQIVHALEQTARLPWSTCLSRAVAAAEILRKRRINAVLKMGALTQPSFRAHAWVEVDGRPWSAAHRQSLQPVSTPPRGPAAQDTHSRGVDPS